MKTDRKVPAAGRKAAGPTAAAALDELDRRLIHARQVDGRAPLAELAAVGEALAAHPEVALAGAVTGPHYLFGSVLCRETGEFYRSPTPRVAALPGVRTTESAPGIRHIKGPGTFPAPVPIAPAARSRR